LAEREAEIYSAVECATGLIDERFSALAAAGVFDAYAQVFREYVALLDDPEAEMEALKRAVFLLWYEVAEPGCFTGLCNLPESLSGEVLARLDATVVGEQLDAELAAMLGYYHLIADFAFSRGGSRHALNRWLAASDPEAWRTRVPVPQHPWSRGQMSLYWASISRVT
jgi:hypothetical protein